MSRKYYNIDLDQYSKKVALDTQPQEFINTELSEYDSIHLFGDERLYDLTRGDIVIAFLREFSGDGIIVDVFSSPKRRKKLLTELDQELEILKTFGLLNYSRDDVKLFSNFLDKVQTWEYWLFSIFDTSQEAALMEIAKKGPIYDINSDGIREHTILDVTINCDAGYFQVTCNDPELFDEFLTFQAGYFLKHRKANR